MLCVHSILQSFLLCLTSVLVTAKVWNIKRRTWVIIDNASALVNILLVYGLIFSEISAAYVILSRLIIVDLFLTTCGVLLYNDIQCFLETLSFLLLAQSHGSIDWTWVTSSLASQICRWFGAPTIASPMFLSIHLGYLAQQIHIFLMQHEKSIQVNATVFLVEKWGHVDIFVTKHQIIDRSKHRFVLYEIEQNFLFGLVSHSCKCFLRLKHLAYVTVRLRSCFICWTDWIQVR